MGKGTLTIFSASAGSGKTWKLTEIYLTHLFESRYAYRKILAVTFTNKATAEMKSRILDHLNRLATGQKSDYLQSLMENGNRSEEWIRKEAGEILNHILHDFTRFSVSTIDSFFQKILRAFARDIGIHSGFNIELDHSVILSSAIDEMIASASSDSLLREWLTTYAISNIDEEKSWNLKTGISKLAEELFKERFKLLSADENSKLEDKKFLAAYVEKIKGLKISFEKQLVKQGKDAEEIYSRFELTEDMFYRKGQGVPRYIKLIASGVIKEPNSYVLAVKGVEPRWSTGEMHPQLQDALSNGLEASVIAVIDFYNEKIGIYKSAQAVLSNIYALGILSDVLLNVHRISNSENSFLLSEAGELLNLITKEDQSPFIYEKIGNRYENFMIDEFQDTSIIQWNNFKPLIENSMAEGNDNLVVGDVKQSIYRWRNSDWRILGRVLRDQVDNERVMSVPLATNWRSRSNVIKFNNTLFTLISAQLDRMLASEKLPVSFKELYSESVQSDPGGKEGGYIRLEFIENSKEKKWQDSVLEKLPGIIETIQEKGYRASDIGIIVRDGREGALVLKTLIDYNNSCSEQKREKYNYSAVSNDSLLLSNSPAVNFIISVLSVVNNNEDMISRALMLRLFLLAKGSKDVEKVPLVKEKLMEVSGDYFPGDYENFLENVKQMPLFEATENIIKFFKLGDYSWNVAYLSNFQDYVVGFTGNRNTDIQSFLDWWQSTGIKKSVMLPDNQDAMRILTIHKSKGLEFKVVVLPFLSWGLDHMPSKQPVLWVKPDRAPFNELGIVPVKYSSDLSNTIFSGDYHDELYSVYLDNINLLYVAFTRAMDALFAFSVENPRSVNTVATILKSAVSESVSDVTSTDLCSFYNSENKTFEMGEILQESQGHESDVTLVSKKYVVSNATESLKLKLHGENYFSSDSQEVQKKINYGKLMHQVFEGISTPDDIPTAVSNLVLEGKLTGEEYSEMVARVTNLIGLPRVANWFHPENEVMKEAGVLLPSGNIRRPDRVIFRDGKTIIIDFKFGEEHSHYAEQVEQYRSLMVDMGYKNIEAFIWYVDKNKIVEV